MSLALVTMTSLALAILLVPLLWRQRRGASRDAYNLTVYRDQLAELDRDLGHGLLNAEQAEAARAEIGRRILPLAPDDDAGTLGAAGPIAAVLGILLLPIAALLLYGRLGSPALPDQPFATSGAAAIQGIAGEAGHIDMNDAVARLRAHLKAHPEDLTGWLLLGRSEVGLGRYAAGAEAYRHAADLTGHRADISADWGEALVLAADGAVTPAAQDAFRAALADPQSAPKARYYLALARLQGGDATGALQAWRELAASAPAGAEWLPLVRQRIAEAEAAAGAASPPPADADVAAAAKEAGAEPPEQRRAMIDAMVERLATRLAAQPDDADGWARLGRSYMVLHEPDKARDAYAHAVKLKPGDSDLKEALAAATSAARAAAVAPGSR